MKAPLKARPSPDEALAIAASTAPQQPPAQMSSPPPLPASYAPTVFSAPTSAPPPAPVDAPTTLNLRVRTSTIEALMDAAKERGMTMKQVVCHALEAAGVPVAPADLEDRTPRRR
jgi:hypothetical protein